MTDILLTTLNARWSHAAVGLRYLRANLGVLRARSAIHEFVIGEAPDRVVERLLAEAPKIIGFGVYIWNVRDIERIMAVLRAVAPEVHLVVGGPEASHAADTAAIVRLATVRIAGEADFAFRQVCDDLLAGRQPPHTLRAPKPDLAAVALPYAEYADEDVTRRIIYVEASRGCPFTCEFCLSSVENGVRAFPLPTLLAAFDDLLRRGCRTFKFVDRTFNLSITTATAILTFFLERLTPDLFLHFELVPDRLPDDLKTLLVRFPPGVIQFEIGIQSFTPEVGVNIRRRMHRERTEANLRWLTGSTGIHLHTDLIIGLPGETLASFQQSFDDLWALGPQEIQVGILKLLPGTPLVRHVGTYAMVFNPEPPYDLLASRDFPFVVMQRLKRFAKYFDAFVNHGLFPRATRLLVQQSPTESPFAALIAFSDWLWAQTRQDHGLARTRHYELMLAYLEVLGVPDAVAVDTVAQDAADQPQGKGLPNRMHAAVEHHRRQRLLSVRGSSPGSPPPLGADYAVPG